MLPVGDFSHSFRKISSIKKLDAMIGYKLRSKMLFSSVGGCAFLEHIYQWVWLFRAFLWMCVGGCDWMWMGG